MLDRIQYGQFKPSPYSEALTRAIQVHEEYPKKVKKKPAAAIWKKKKPDVEVLIADIQERLARDSQWQTKDFIPNPTTYLNDEGWNDEICIRNSSKPGNGITQTPLDRHHEAVRGLEQQSNDEIVG